MKKFIMAVDHGTTGSRVMLVDRGGTVRGSDYAEFAQIYPRPGWVEHDAESIWETTLAVMKRVLVRTGIGPDRIAAVGITNQRETSVLWDRKTLRPVHNAIVWQCRRSAPICQGLKAGGFEKKFRSRTGLLLDAYFSGTKIAWLLEEVPGIRTRAEAGDLAFGTMDSWLMARLTGGRLHVTDYTNASRTLMLNIHDKTWDPELLEILGIPPVILPRVVPSSGIVGEVDAGVLGEPVPIAGVAGDQQAALFGQACFKPGQAKNTYGTGCFLLQNIGDCRVDPGVGLILTLACDGQTRPCYAIEGSIFIAGAVVQWLRDGLGVIKDVCDSQRIAETVEDTHGVYFVPAFSGLGAPYWDMYARGGIFGLTRGATLSHLVRAALESIAFQTRDLADAFEALSGESFNELRVDGGASRNDFLMQFQADILNCPVSRSCHIESTGMGAAYLAGLAVGFWSSTAEISNLRKSDRVFLPLMDSSRRRDIRKGWKEAVERVRCRDE